MGFPVLLNPRKEESNKNSSNTINYNILRLIKREIGYSKRQSEGYGNSQAGICRKLLHR